MGAPKSDKESLTDLSVTVTTVVNEKSEAITNQRAHNQRLSDDAKTIAIHLDGLKSQHEHMRISRRGKAEENALKINAVADLDEQIKDLKEANRKIAADFDDNRAAIQELADWQSAHGCTISSVKLVSPRLHTRSNFYHAKKKRESKFVHGEKLYGGVF